MPTLHKNGGVYAPAIGTWQKQSGLYVPNVGVFSKQDAAYQSVFGGGGGTPTVWNAADKSADLTLSNGDRTLTSTATSWKSARAVLGLSTGKYYFEMTMSAAHFVLGMANGGAAIINSYIGSAASSAGLRTETGDNFTSGFDLAGTGPGGSAIAATYGIAVDLDARKIWMRKDAAAFPGTGNPETGASPYWTYATPLTLFPAASVFTLGGFVTLNAGQEAFVGAVPAGYTAGWSA